MGRQAPEGLVGIHTNLLVPALSGTMPTKTDEERAAAAQIATFGQSGHGYFIEMATRPQTIGYALLDSPIALAASSGPETQCLAPRARSFHFDAFWSAVTFGSQGSGRTVPVSYATSEV